MSRRRRMPAQQRKAARLGLAQGLTKPMLDAMNVEAKARFGLGVGVIAQERERAWLLCGSLVPITFWARFSPRRRAAARGAAREFALWDGRLNEVARAVSANTDPEVAREAVERYAR